MEKTGSLDKIHAYLLLELSFLKARNIKHTENQYQNAIASTTVELKKIQEKGDLAELLAAEYSIIKFELANYSLTSNAKNSLNTAINTYENQKECLKIILSKNYDIAFSLFGLKTSDNAMLPKDATREFLEGQIARLNNSSKTTTLSQNEAQKLMQRRSNMQVALTIYKNLQKQAQQKLLTN